MKVTSEKVDGKIKLTIEVEKEVLEKAAEAVYKKIAPSVKVAGFRPGKAPRNLVEKEIGQDRFQAEILDEVLPTTYYDAIVQEKLEVAGAPEVKVLKFVPTDGLTYEALVEIMPEVKLPDLSKIEVKREKVEVKDDEVKETLTDLAKQLSKPEVVERAAKSGDRVDINFEGFLDGVAFEGGKSENYPLVLGSGSFIPGFEEQLEGMKANDEKDIKVTFPKEYHAENLAGKEVTFKVKMNQIEEIIMPEMTDEFAKLVGPFETLEALKEDIKKELLKSKEMQERKRVEEAILEEMAKSAKFEAPSALAHQEMHRLLHEAEQNLAYSGMNLEKYFEMTGSTMEQLEEQMKPEAEKRVKVGLLLTEVAKEQKFDVTDQEITEAIAKRVEYLPEDQKKETEDYYDSHDGRHQLENMIVGQKVIDYLYENCSK
jgi:trigger factor